MAAVVAFVSNVPLIPSYAPVPESGTIRTGAVAEPADEHVVGSKGIDASLFPRSFTSIEKEPFERTSLLIPSVGVPWWSVP